jgi:hypothetical protein
MSQETKHDMVIEQYEEIIRGLNHRLADTRSEMAEVKARMARADAEINARVEEVHLWQKRQATSYQGMETANKRVEELEAIVERLTSPELAKRLVIIAQGCQASDAGDPVKLVHQQLRMEIEADDEDQS